MERRNERDSHCYRCHQEVAPNEGWLRKSVTRWLVVCDSCSHPPEGTHSGWHTEPMVALDLETTGRDVAADRVVSACVVLEDGSTRSWLVNPGCSIPAEATRIHGITTAMVESDGVSTEVFLNEIRSLLDVWITERWAVAIMNARFDMSVLYHEFDRMSVSQPDWNGLCVADPLILDWHMDKMRSEPRQLPDLCSRHGVDLGQHHDAVADAQAALAVARSIARKHVPTAQQPTGYLTSTQRRWRREYFEWAAKKRRISYEPEAEGWPITAILEHAPVAKERDAQGAPATPHRKWSEEEAKLIASEYQKGASIEDLARRYGRSERAIDARLRKLGLRSWTAAVVE